MHLGWWGWEVIIWGSWFPWQPYWQSLLKLQWNANQPYTVPESGGIREGKAINSKKGIPATHCKVSLKSQK